LEGWILGIRSRTDLAEIEEANAGGRRPEIPSHTVGGHLKAIDVGFPLSLKCSKFVIAQVPFLGQFEV
jgi:hypothetical protein